MLTFNQEAEDMGWHSNSNLFLICQSHNLSQISGQALESSVDMDSVVEQICDWCKQQFSDLAALPLFHVLAETEDTRTSLILQLRRQQRQIILDYMERLTTPYPVTSRAGTTLSHCWEQECVVRKLEATSLCAFDTARPGISIDVR